MVQLPVSPGSPSTWKSVWCFWERVKVLKISCKARPWKHHGYFYGSSTGQVEYVLGPWRIAILLPYNLFSASIHSDVGGVEALEAERPDSSPRLAGFRRVTAFVRLWFFNYKVKIMITDVFPYTIISTRACLKFAFFFPAYLWHMVLYLTYVRYYHYCHINKLCIKIKLGNDLWRERLL